MTVSEIFENEPSKYGLRGDRYLWREMRETLKDVEMPQTAEELKRLIEETYEAATGYPISYERSFLVDRFKHGGMSSGRIDPDFWVSRGIPLLVERHEWPKIEGIQINVNRNATCMADDSYDNSYSFTMPATSSLNDIFKHLADTRYIQRAAGGNIGWRAVIKGETVATVKGSTGVPEPSIYLDEKISNYTSDGMLIISFHYQL